MTNPKVRLRFAPSPTGLMHLGGIRTALMNFLFARQKKGTYILRIEDTDASRNFDPGAQQIIADLKWLSLTHDEGPIKGGPYAPYFQSERLDIYQEHLAKLQAKGLAYRCFCSSEELERKKQRQIALKQPPRYDRTCVKLSSDKINELIANKIPFIWRIQLNQDKKITIQDMSHGPIIFDLKNFSDFPLTRQDGSFTFMFANFADDLSMKISHVVRGADHLTNTAGQAALYDAFDATLPIFWHMPILCSIDGKKMSKRDFGFSLTDLKNSGYLPEAIINYLALIGGGNFEHEIMSLEELINTFDFDHIAKNDHVKYDSEKLKWVNHKWIDRLSPEDLVERCRPILEHTFPATAVLNNETLSRMLQILKPGFETINDCAKELRFYFTNPIISPEQLQTIDTLESIQQLVTKHLMSIKDANIFVNNLKNDCKATNITIKSLFHFLRLALMGTTKGPAIHELIEILGSDEAQKRIENALSIS